MKKIIAAMLSLIALAAHAERADSLKQASVTAVKVDADTVTNNTIASGDVVITRGTLLIKSDKAVVSQSPEGYMTVTLTSDPGKFATFRQKRDGGADLWVEGHAQRIEYDERTEIVKLFNNAVVKQLENGRLTNEMNGEFISYDNRKEVAALRNDASGETKQGAGRTTVIFQPRRQPAAAPAPAPAAGKQ
ncbi:lipopolysaccharide transport periplasmic protein LptA [Massilia horti]|uniref:Lipopolysaccharide export system protein LptA n=1 Tax=Massilia horti TaxID=2562153 RepID=A0A4Y9SWD2_9BURK|nr:lipopolysaccharide transport periplasmic protein LptA [Massilia horti]TFW30775.1 lipopolysaccharide transport periplasmic protein LptA [Massilia horti]